MKTIKAMRLTQDNFSEFGRAVYIESGTVPDAQSDIQTYYGKLAFLECSGSMQVGVCVAKKRPYVVNELEQHADSPELLAALKGDFLTPVTTSIEIDGRLVPDMDNIRAVIVNQGEGIVFDAGMWHWTPYAITESCDVLVIFKTDTPSNDFISYQLDDTIAISV
jgi:ureidoglycolate hydrolase